MLTLIQSRIMQRLKYEISVAIGPYHSQSVIFLNFTIMCKTKEELLYMTVCVRVETMGIPRRRSCLYVIHQVPFLQNENRKFSHKHIFQRTPKLTMHILVKGFRRKISLKCVSPEEQSRGHKIKVAYIFFFHLTQLTVAQVLVASTAVASDMSTECY